jgi:hypothetical protein
LLAGLPLLGAAELLAQWAFVGAAPPVEAYAALARPVADLKRQGEPVVVAPRWAEPLVRAALDEALLPIDEQAPADLDRYASVLEVSFADHGDPALSRWEQQETRHVGPFALRRLVNPTAPPPTVDLVSAFGASVQVFLRPRVTLPGQAPAKPERACQWSTGARVLSGGLGGHPTLPRERFACPGGHYHSVGVTVIADHDYRPRRCVWAHPPPTGELVIRYPESRLGERIVGHTGIEWMMQRSGRGAPVALSIRVAEHEIARLIHVDGDGWAAFDVPLGERAGTSGAIEIAVSSPDHRNRHFCFEASVQ